jgi:hypothetical protein
MVTGADKPLVLVDVDGVLADFVGATVEHLVDFGVPASAERVTGYDIPMALGLTDEQTAHVHALWSWDAFHSILHPYDDALDAWNELRAIADVHIVTKPYPGSRSWVPSRLAWLGRWFGVNVTSSGAGSASRPRRSHSRRARSSWRGTS